jgi:hypothetical protein
MFEKPEEKERRRLRPLYIKGHVDGQPMTKMMVDGGAAVNVMPYTTYRKLGKDEEDLIRTDMVLKDFEGKTSPAQGAINVELTIRSKSLPTTFFIINGKGSYNLLLGCDWIYANCCIPSTMHQCLIQWLEDIVEVVPADSSLSIAIANPQIWRYDGVECISGKVWEGDFLKMSDFGLKPIQAIGSEESS